LLAEPEGILLRRLAVFVSGWTLEAAEAVCAGNGLERSAVLDALGGLVKKSLVVVEEQGEHLRYRLLETVRQYGREHLEAAQELIWAREQHLAYYLTLARHTEAQLCGPQMGVWRQVLDREFEELRAAFRWAMDSAAWEQALRLAGDLGWYWGLCGLVAEGHDWLEEALRHAGEVGRTEAVARALEFCAGFSIAFYLSDYPLARPRLEESLAIWRELGNQHQEAQMCYVLGRLARFEGELAQAQRLMEESLPLLERAGDEWNVVRVATWLAVTAFEQQNYQQAQHQFEQALFRARKLGNPWCLSSVLELLGELNHIEGKEDQAETCYGESMRYDQETGDLGHYAETMTYLGQLVRARGDVRRGFLLGLEAIHTLLRRGVNLRIFTGLIQLAATLWFLREPRLAARCSGAAEAFQERYDVVLPPTDQIRCARDLATLQGLKDDASLAAAWAEGRALSLEQLLALVDPLVDTLETAPASERTASPTMSPAALALSSPGAPQVAADLSPREHEVLHLLAQGLTNPQIAVALVISPSTVNTHVVALFNKLGVNTRAAATRYAVEHHLV
jgi:DNA-binding CsgD family transcriptional regulator/tetratricopeptide (TPR) repeat protein